jgi:hypothetical protein
MDTTAEIAEASTEEEEVHEEIAIGKKSDFTSRNK